MTRVFLPVLNLFILLKNHLSYRLMKTHGILFDTSLVNQVGADSGLALSSLSSDLSHLSVIRRYCLKRPIPGGM